MSNKVKLNASYFRLEGKVDDSNVKAIADRITQFESCFLSSTYKLDCGRITEISGLGLRQLASLIKSTRSRGTQMILIGFSAELRSKITELLVKACLIPVVNQILARHHTRDLATVQPSVN